MVIYLITNLINGKQYVGQTIQLLENRWSMHKSGSSGCLGLKAAFKKYGIENFKIEQIDTSNSLEELNKKEREYIKNLKTLSPFGYNLTTGGEQNKYSDESRKKMSESGKKRRPISESTRKKLSECRKGSKNHNFGKKFTEDHKRKLSEAHLGNHSRERVKIFCNENGKFYDSLSDAAKALSINVGHLHQVINGKRKSAKGYTFTKEIK